MTPHPPPPQAEAAELDAFSADVVVTVSRSGARGVMGVPRRMVYHLETFRDASGKLRSTITLDPSQHYAKMDPRAPVSPMAIARIENSGNDSGLRFFNAAGKELVRSGDLGPAPIVGADQLRSSAARRAELQRHSATSTLIAGSGRSIDRTALRGIVMPGSQRDVRVAQLRQQLGVPRRVTSQFEEYESVRDTTSVVVRLDRELGAPVEVKHLVRGVMRQRVEYGYSRQPDGSIVRVRTLVETKAREGSPWTGTSMLTEYRNLRLNQRGSK